VPASFSSVNFPEVALTAIARSPAVNPTHYASNDPDRISERILEISGTASFHQAISTDKNPQASPNHFERMPKNLNQNQQ